MVCEPTSPTLRSFQSSFQTDLLFENSIGSDHVTKQLSPNVSINSTERIIEQINISVKINRSCQADTLFLTSTQVDALLM